MTLIYALISRQQTVLAENTSANGEEFLFPCNSKIIGSRDSTELYA